MFKIFYFRCWLCCEYIDTPIHEDIEAGTKSCHCGDALKLIFFNLASNVTENISQCFNWQYGNIGSNNSAPIRRQAKIWTNDGLNYWCTYALHMRIVNRFTNLLCPTVWATPQRLVIRVWNNGSLSFWLFRVESMSNRYPYQGVCSLIHCHYCAVFGMLLYWAVLWRYDKYDACTGNISKMLEALPLYV